jgi:hypothetical protein
VVIQHALEFSGAALVGLYVVAQVPMAETSTVIELIKLGSTGVVGVVCILLIKSGEKRDKVIADLAKAIDRMIEHCSKNTKDE